MNPVRQLVACFTGFLCAFLLSDVVAHSSTQIGKNLGMAAICFVLFLVLTLVRK